VSEADGADDVRGIEKVRLVRATLEQLAGNNDDRGNARMADVFGGLADMLYEALNEMGGSQQGGEVDDPTA